MNSKELSELILQNTRIILPEFGAFLVKDSREKGFVPSNVSFSPFLRYNDGMLEVYMAKTKGISKEEAAKDVRNFIEIVKNELLEKGAFEIEGIGWLKRDQRGSLSFSAVQPENNAISIEKAPNEKVTETTVLDEKEANKKENDQTAETSSTKTRKKAESKVKSEKVEIKKKGTRNSKKAIEAPQEPISETSLEPIVEQKLEQEPISPEIKIEERSEPKEIIVEPIKQEEDKVKSYSFETQVEEIKSETKPISEEKNEPIFIQPEKKKSGVSRFIYTLVAIALIVIAVLAIRSYYFAPSVDNQDEIVSTAGKPENNVNEAKDKVEKPKDDIEKAYNEAKTEVNTVKETKQKEEAQEEAIKNTLIKNEQVKSEQIKKTDATTSNSIKYYIIAGSFKNREFAQKYLNELNKAGNKAIIVIQPSGMNAVALGAYNTRNEASEAMKSLKEKYPNLWILKK